MIERLRRGAQSSLSYILIGVLIVFFAVFFGVPADGCMAGDGSRVHMATVGGDDIHTEDVNPVFVNFFGGARRGSSQAEEVTMAQARALQIVITIHLLAKRAEQAGLRVSDEEFARFMYDPSRNTEFVTHYGRTGQFAGDYYRNTYVPNILRTPIPAYENFKRRELLARKYLAMLDMQAQATPDEVEERFRLENTRVDLEFVRIDRGAIADVVGIDDDAIDAFLDDADNQERLQQYYDEHIDDYTSPEEIKVSRLRVTKPTTSDEAQQALSEFDDARRRIVDEGEDFATVAAQVQDGNDGSMGWRTLDAIDQDISDALGDAEVGAVQEIETDMAWMLVRLDDRRDEEVEPLEDVERDIAETLLREDSFEQYGRTIADDLHARLTEGMTFEEALADLAGDPLDEEEEADDQETDDEEVAEDDEATEEADLDPRAEILASLSTESTGFFNLVGQQFGDMGIGGRSWDEVPRLGRDQELAIQAFELTEEAPVHGEVVDLNGSLVVIRLLEREEPDEEDLTSEEFAELATLVRLEKVSELIGPWREFFMGPRAIQQPPELFYQAIYEPGGYFDSIFREGVEDGTVRLRDRNSRAAADLKQMLEQDPALTDAIELTP